METARRTLPALAKASASSFIAPLSPGLDGTRLMKGMNHDDMESRGVPRVWATRTACTQASR